MNIKDDVYAYALSKTLTTVSSPTTVGLYSSCPDRINLILQQTQEHMDQEAQKIEQRNAGRSARPRPAKPSLCSLVSLLCKLLFYRPAWAENHHQEHLRFVNVHFSAWHFAGSDLLWAGLVLRLCHAMQVHFGRLPLSLYRTVQYDEEEEIRKKVLTDGQSCLKPRMFCCFPLWLIVLFVLIVMVITCIVLALFGFPEVGSESMGQINGTTAKQIGVGEGVALAVVGVPAAGATKFIVELVKNLMRSQNRNIHSIMDNVHVSSQLGFMNEVRKEIWLLTNFIHFMELFEGRRIRVVMRITNLDRCSPTKIVSVLQAINILLSDQDSPLILILAVDPEVIVQKVNFADGCLCREDRAYAFLNRIVTLSFTIPPLNDESKCKVFYGLTRRAAASKTDTTDTQTHKRGVFFTKSTLDSMERAEDHLPLMGTTNADQDMLGEVENLITSAFKSFKSDGGKLKKYILDDSMSMRRVINSIRMTVTIMKSLKIEVPQADHIAAWVVLANYWPCRLSWLLNCVEDDQQRLKIDGGDTSDSEEASQTLWQVFRESRVELYMIREQIDDLLEQDSDPEMFEMLLKVDFPFTMKELKVFVPVTVNLDLTIRKELGHIRGVSKLRESGWTGNVIPLPIKTIVNMSVEDVCSELERMHLNDNYAKVVRDNDLNGLALVFGDVDHLKVLFAMTLGQWTAFRLRFWGFTSDRRQTNIKRQTPSPCHRQHHHASQPS